MQIKSETYTPEQLAAIRKEYAGGATDEQFQNFIRETETRKLIPGRHVYFQTRKSWEYDPEIRKKVPVKKAVLITSIDAFRLIAQRTGEYQGQDEPVYIYLDDDGKPTVRSTIVLPEDDNTERVKQPWACEISVFRKNFQKPLTVSARFWAYANTYKDGDAVKLTDMWERRGAEQLCKCTEAQALRKAFPEELAGLYLAEEFKDEQEESAIGKAASEQPAGSTPAAAATPPAAVSKPAVDHTPAEGKDAPRPGEKDAKKKTRAKKATEKPAAEAPAPEAAPAPEQAPPAAEKTQLERELEGEEEKDRPMTPEEKTEIFAKVREFKAKLEKHGVGSDAVRAYIERFSGSELGKLGYNAWIKVLQKFDSAVDEKDLAEMVKKG